MDAARRVEHRGLDMPFFELAQGRCHGINPAEHGVLGAVDRLQGGVSAQCHIVIMEEAAGNFVVFDQ